MLCIFKMADTLSFWLKSFQTGIKEQQQATTKSSASGNVHPHEASFGLFF